MKAIGATRSSTGCRDEFLADPRRFAVARSEPSLLRGAAATPLL